MVEDEYARGGLQCSDAVSGISNNGDSGGLLIRLVE